MLQETHIEKNETNDPIDCKPMHRKLREVSYNDIYDMVQVKQDCYSKKYFNHCQRFGILYPSVGERERDHLNQCHSCQKTWPLYLFEQHYVNKRPIDDVTREWCDLPETIRVEMLTRLGKADRLWLRNMLKLRTPLGYQMFCKDVLTSNETIKSIKDIMTRARALGQLWRAQPIDVRQKYELQSHQAKIDRANELAALPDFKKRQIAAARSEHRRMTRGVHPTKPANAYMLFQSSEWAKEKEKPNHITYKDFVHVVAKMWRTSVTDEQKKYFIELAEKERNKYFVSRNECVKQMKLKKLLKTATVHSDNEEEDIEEKEEKDIEEKEKIKDHEPKRQRVT